MKITKVFLLGVLLNAAPISTATIVLSSSGLYRLAADITGNDAPANTAIITITASNVTLDLDGHTVTQGSGTHTGVQGISCAAGIENVTIKNGCVRGVSGVGILIEEECSAITVDALACADCAGGHITGAGTSGNPANGITLSHCTFTETTTLAPAAIVTLTYCNGAILKELTVESIVAPTVNLSAISISNCTGVSLSHCLASNISAKSITGFACNNTTGCTFTECTAQSLSATGSSGIAYGFNITNSSRIVQNKILASLIQTITPATDAYGIYWSDVLYCALIDSIVDGVQAARDGYGMFATTVQQSEIDNNQFLNNSGVSLNRGLKIVSSTDNLIVKNIAFRNGTTAAEQIDGLSSSATTDLNTTTGNISTLGSLWTNLRAF